MQARAAAILLLFSMVMVGCGSDEVVTPDLSAPTLPALSISSQTDSSVTLSLSFPVSVEYPTRYEVRHGNNPVDFLTEGGLSLTTRREYYPIVDRYQIVVDSLPSNTELYFAMRVADENGNWSGLSNIVEGRTYSRPPRFSGLLDLDSAVDIANYQNGFAFLAQDSIVFVQPGGRHGWRWRRSAQDIDKDPVKFIFTYEEVLVHCRSGVSGSDSVLVFKSVYGDYEYRFALPTVWGRSGYWRIHAAYDNAIWCTTYTPQNRYEVVVLTMFGNYIRSWSVDMPPEALGVLDSPTPRVILLRRARGEFVRDVFTVDGHLAERSYIPRGGAGEIYGAPIAIDPAGGFCLHYQSYADKPHLLRRFTPTGELDTEWPIPMEIGVYVSNELLISNLHAACYGYATGNGMTFYMFRSP